MVGQLCMQFGFTPWFLIGALAFLLTCYIQFVNLVVVFVKLLVGNDAFVWYLFRLGCFISRGAKVSSVDALFIPLKNPSMKHIMSKTEKLMHYILILKVVTISFILFSSSDAPEQLT